MNRKKFIRHLTSLGCSFDRHGSGHDLWWDAERKFSVPVPRHGEVKPDMVRTICKQLNISRPAEK